MSITLTIDGDAIPVAETGRGEPLLYLHGFADIHGSNSSWLPFHENLAQSARVLAPPHPGCDDTVESDEIDTIEDAVFHYFRVVDGLGLDRFHLAGASIGGWLAAEIAVRLPERVRSLSLIGATGLYLPNEPIGDIFMMGQSSDGGKYDGFRRMLFRSEDAPEALEMFPDGLMPIERELLRYRMFRFASRVGFSPPYLHDRKLRGRLDRYGGPVMVIAGEQDHLVPQSHARAYAEGFGHARLRMIAAAGNSLIVEQPEKTAAAVRENLQRAEAVAA